MRYPYYSPNFRLVDLMAASFMSEQKADQLVVDYFAELTGKKYIILTNSCRSALYITYKALGIQGQVITSPLTCKASIDPIIETGNRPVFADINPYDLNILTEDIEHRITDKAIAIQAIHFGGIACNMTSILSIAQKKNLYIIEDCAQSLGATYEGKLTGSFGDIACFSLIKNGYGIGGGILAIDDMVLYERAKRIYRRLRKGAPLLIFFRIFRNLLDTKRSKYRFFSVIYNLLMSLKGEKKSYTTVIEQLRQISGIEKRVAARQILKFPTLHKMRKQIGKAYCERLTKYNIMFNHKFDKNASSFTKFFVYHPAIKSKKIINFLRRQGIEAMHLEQTHRNSLQVQKKIVSNQKAFKNKLYRYIDVHDSILSLPICEDLPNNEIIEIVHYYIIRLSRKLQ